MLKDKSSRTKKAISLQVNLLGDQVSVPFVTIIEFFFPNYFAAGVLSHASQLRKKRGNLSPN